MKIDKFIAVYKKGDKEDPSNYRPIAMTSALSKVYKQVFLNRLQYHFERNNILNLKSPTTRLPEGKKYSYGTL
jgi:hypothetical protein